MEKAFFIMAKEVRDFLRDKGDLAFSILLPVLIFALIYGAFGGSLQFNGTAYVVNQDKGGQYSTQLIDRLKGYRGLTVQQLSAEDANARLSRAAILMAVFIPPDFSARLSSNQTVAITIKERGNGGTEGQIVTSLVQGAAAGVQQGIVVLNAVQSYLADRGVSPQLVALTVKQVTAEEESSPSVTVKETLVGSKPDPINQFMPGILTMFVLFAINLTAQSFVDERRKGTLERLLVSRLRIGELFAGKFLAYTARGFVQTLVLLVLAYAVFRIFTPISFLEALLLALIFAAACSTIGLIIGSISRTQNQATWISVFFTMLMVMLSGTFVAIPRGTALYTLSRLSINTYANDAFGIIISKGGSLAEARTDILVMLVVLVIGLVVSRFLFRATQGVR